MKKPSKKIIILGIVLIFGAAITTYALFGKSQKETYTMPVVSEITANPALAKDSDNDGLKDWEEKLWKTDPNNPDTDGDGTKDGEEIKSGRNPLVTGPKDKLDSETVAKKVNLSTDEDLTDTDKFSRELFLKIIAAKQSGLSPDEAGFDEFLNTTIRNEVEKQQPKSYAAKDFKIDSAETPEKLKAYGNIIADILTKPPPQKLEYELTILYRAEADKNPNELKQLEPLIKEYKRIESDLLAVVVPKSALEVHLFMINSTVSTAWSISGLAYILTDPIKALPGASTYADNSQAFHDAMKNFKQFFFVNGVSFEPESNGYRLFNSI